MKNILDSKLNISDKKSDLPPKETLKKTQGVRRGRVFVGMSGGVDSSVSAYLLKQQGYEVTGVFIKVWQPDNTDCGWKDERRDAMRVAAVLDIPFLTLDFSEQYKREVVDYMIEEYRLGRTPNPDVMCNRHVKFGSFLDYARKHGADFIATGHYAQNILSKNIHKETDIDGMPAYVFEMKEGVDTNKDQTYFLWTLTQDDLKCVLFPIGHLEKPEVRKIAEKAGLPVFDKKDSQGVCFIGHVDMKAFLKEYITTKPGNVLDLRGQVIGKHEGAELYTIGERHGFIIENMSISSEPRFIISKDIKDNTLTVATASEQLKMTQNNGDSSVSQDQIKNGAQNNLYEVKLTNTSFSQKIDSYIEKKVFARIRYRQEKQLCIVQKSEKEHGSYVVVFDTPQKGMAEGQSVVLYDGNTCLGGGILNFI